MPLNTHYSVVPSYAEAVAEKSWIPVWAEPIYTTQVTLNVSKPSDNERYQRTYEYVHSGIRPVHILTDTITESLLSLGLFP
jgi:hypothetical protein